MLEATNDSCAVGCQCAACAFPVDAPSDFRALAKRTVYSPRQLIFAEGAPSAGLYLVCRGAVRLYHSDPFGREHVLATVGPGALLGEFALDGARPVSISAQALPETELAFLPRARFEWLVRQHPETAMWLLDALSLELGRARRRVRDLTLKGAEARLAALLLELVGAGKKQASGTRIVLDYRRREIAEMIGVSTETAIRLLAKLHAKGVIAVHRRDVAITDAERLTRIASLDETAV
jgi:CRP-like cAMP-binding protein